MTFHIHKDLIFAFLALLIIAALVLLYGKANGRRWVSPVVFGLLLLGAWFGWFSIIRGIFS